MAIIREQISTALTALSPNLDAEDARDVREYLDYGELGIAWELLWHVVREERLTAPQELIAAGRAMGFDPS